MYSAFLAFLLKMPVKVHLKRNKSIIMHPKRHPVWMDVGPFCMRHSDEILHQETGIDPAMIEVKVDTVAGLPTGMTTSSRATALLGNAIIDASGRIREDLKHGSLQQLAGRVYKGKFAVTGPANPAINPIIL